MMNNKLQYQRKFEGNSYYLLLLRSNLHRIGIELKGGKSKMFINF